LKGLILKGLILKGLFLKKLTKDAKFDRTLFDLNKISYLTAMLAGAICDFPTVERTE